ncbi:MAG: hypothetical protein LCH61_15670 [Proteobacteria bacterium]|nr:hypothetical protein [Pseudomonadota bacterium]
MFKKIIFSTCGILLLTGCNTTGINKTMLAGQTQRLTFYTSLNADCTSNGVTTVRVVSGPSNGSVSMVNGRGHPSYAQSNQRYHCNAHSVPGVIANYKPNAGFRGSDSVTLEAFFPSGNTGITTYNITVR